MMGRSPMFLLVVLLLQSTTRNNAFVTQPSTPTARATRLLPLLHSSSSSKDDNNSSNNIDDELQDLEQARANFEFLMHTEGLIRDNAILPLPHTPSEYTPRPLTESSRHRRELEMELIASLADSDDAIEELMALWMVERGMEAAEQLQEMEQTCSPGLVKEEEILRALLEEYGIHWAEPVSRLASLLYFKGNSAESEQWCEIALAVKPWHFEVVHTHVLNALRKEDLPAAVRWQRKALPPLNTRPKARKAWVQQALKDAQESLDKAQAAAMAKKQQGRTFLQQQREKESWQ